MSSNKVIIHGNLAYYEIISENRQYYISSCPEKIKNGSYKSLTGRDPGRQVTRLLGEFKLKKGFLVFVYGVLQLNLLLKLIEDKNKNGGIIVLVEPDEKLVLELRKFVPEIFENTYLIEKHGYWEQLNDFFDSIEISSIIGYKILTNGAIQSTDPVFFEEFDQNIKKLYSTRLSDLFTRFEFESRWVSNALINASQAYRAKPVYSLFNTMEGKSAIMVSTGPGLRGALPWIKKNQNNFFIAAVDSAYRVLHRCGIKPDLIYSLDSQGYTLRHILGIPVGKNNDSPVLVADLVANPQVVLRWKGELFFSTTAHYKGDIRHLTPGCDFVEEEILQTPVGDIQSGGSVATSLFDLLRQMGFSKILFAGQDLAFTFHEVHTTGTHHTDIWLSKNSSRLNSIENINYSAIKKRTIHYEEDARGKQIPVDYILSVYRQWFEDAIAKSKITVQKIGKVGAIIKAIHAYINTETINSSEFSQERMNKINLAEIGKRIPYNQNIFLKFYDKLKKTDSENFLNDNDSIYYFMKLIGRKELVRNTRRALRSSSTEESTTYSGNYKVDLEKKLFLDRLKQRLKNLSLN